MNSERVQEEVNAFLMPAYKGRERGVWADLESLRRELQVRVAAVEQERSQRVGGVTVRKTKWGEGEFKFWDGEAWRSYEEILNRSLAKFPNGKVKERFEAEKVGWLKAGQIAPNLRVDQAMVIGSPPADIYRDKQGGALTANFVLVKLSEDEWLVYSLYVPEIDFEKHKSLLGLEVEEVNEMVKTPIIFENEGVDELVGRLGFNGWGEVVRRATDLDAIDRKVEVSKPVNQAIESLWQEFNNVVDKKFWLVFSDMIYDFLIKDIKGHLEDNNIRMLRKEGLIFLYERLVKEGDLIMSQMLSWKLFGLGITADHLDQWRKRQEAFMEQRWYQVIFGGAHGSGVFSFGQGSWRFADWQRRWNMAELRQERQIECKKCHHQFITMSDGKVKCPNCGAEIKVS